MKRKTIIVLLSLILTVTTLGIFGIVASETVTTPDMTIAYCNLSFQNSVCIKYAVKSNVSDVKILIWTSPQVEYTVGTHDDEITEYYTEKISGVEHLIFDYAKLTAKQMTDVVYACAYSRVNGEDYYSEVNKYSILQYAYNKLGKTGTASNDVELKEMLTYMLAYGAAAQKYLDNYNVDRLATADYYQIKVTDGTLDDGCKQGLYLAGDIVTLNAPETDECGSVFSHWAHSDGNIVATTATYQITVESKNEVYTPVYVSPLEYELGDDGTYYSVIGIGTCKDEDVIIPATYKGLPITSIGRYAFWACTSLTSITIPDSVTSIGRCAFWACTSLTSVNIPEGVTIIEYGAFESCSSLTNIVIPNGVTSIGGYAFYECTGISSINIPISVTKIEKSAFRDTALTKIDYDGTEEEWESIEIQSNNDELTNIKPSKVPMFYDYVEKCFNVLGQFSSPNDLTGWDIFSLGEVSPNRITEEEYYVEEYEEWAMVTTRIYLVSDLDKYSMSIFGQTYDYSDIASRAEASPDPFSFDYSYDAENEEIYEYLISGWGGDEPKYSFEYDNYVEIENGKFEINYHYVEQIWNSDYHEVTNRIDTDITGKIVVELVDGNYLMRSHTVTHPEN